MAARPLPRVEEDMDRNTKKHGAEIQMHKIDYEEFARESGEEAYQNAKRAGLPEEVALRFKVVFGTPIDPEYRTS